MSDALRLADAIDPFVRSAAPDHHDVARDAAAELRRLHAENEALKADTKSLATMSNLWAKEKALNAELVKALKHAAECVQTNYLPDKCGHDWDDVIAKAEASK